MSQCVTLHFMAGAMWPCDEEAVEEVRSACVHEHVRVAPQCAMHAARAREVGRVTWCRVCFEHPAEPHRCQLFAAPLT